MSRHKTNNSKKNPDTRRTRTLTPASSSTRGSHGPWPLINHFIASSSFQVSLIILLRQSFGSEWSSASTFTVSGELMRLQPKAPCKIVAAQPCYWASCWCCEVCMMPGFIYFFFFFSCAEVWGLNWMIVRVFCFFIGSAAPPGVKM